jgi:signal transduction histidine kinase/CheY-like chemotaxis protein
MAHESMVDPRGMGAIHRAWHNFITSDFREDEHSPEMRRVMFLNIFAFITILALVVFGTINLLADSRWASFHNGIIEIASALAGSGILLYLRISHRIRLCTNLTMILIVVVMTFLLYTGGMGQTGIFWWFCFPPGAFYLKGKTAGWRWVLGTYLIFGTTLLFSMSGVTRVPYDPITLRQFMAAYFVVSLLMYTYETIRAEYEQQIARNTNEILEANQRLSLEVEERKKTEEALGIAKLEAEQANRSKTEFLSKMSHEFRTPMNSILGFSQLLDTDTVEPLSDSQRESVAEIMTAGKHLLALINEVLDLARIEAGRMQIHLQPTDIRPLVSDAIAGVKPLANEKRLRIHDEISNGPARYVSADPNRLKQVILNLLSNAIKYNHDEGLIRMEGCNTDDGRVTVSVTDTGIGIPEDRQKLVFKPFRRLSTGEESIEGTGIGLTISRQLMTLMGGSIRLKSTPGLGSCFTIELPASDPLVSDDRSDTDHAHEPPSESSARTGTVLYVEDDLSNLALVEHILLRRPGIRLIHAAQGHLGVELAQAHNPDLVLLDIRLPDISGIEVLDTLKSNDATSAIPVVIVTASAMPHEKEELLGKDIEAYLTKPLDVHLFLQTLDRILHPVVDEKPATLDGEALL